MIRLSSQDLERVSAGLLGLYSCLDIREMPHVILSMLAELVPADFASYNEFNEAKPRDVVAVTKPVMPEIMAHASAFEATSPNILTSVTTVEPVTADHARPPSC